MTSTAGCVDSAQWPVQVLGAPAPAFTTDGPACAGEPLDFTNTTPGSGLTCAWSFGDGATATTWNATHAYANPGTYTATLAVTLTGGCSGWVQHQVQVLALPAATIATETQPLSGGGTVVTFTAAGGPGLLCDWTYGDGAAGSGNPAAAHLRRRGRLPGGPDRHQRGRLLHGDRDPAARGR